MKTLFSDYINRSIPLLFSISISIWIMDSFYGETMPITLVLVFFIHSLVFIGMIQAGKSRLGVYLFVLGTVLYFAAIILVIDNTRAVSGILYPMWLANLQPDNKGIYNLPYWLATVFLISYMFSVIVFYFSCIRNRIGMLFMAGCIPLLLHTAKNDKGITLPFLFFILCFMCLYAGKNRLLITKHSEGRSGKWYLIAVSGFALLIIGLSIILPKPLISPKLAELEGFVFETIQPLINPNAQNTSSDLETFILEKSDISQELDKASFPNSDRVLFMVEADEPLYLRIQSFEKYEGNRWFTEDSYLNSSFPPELFYKRQLKLDILSALVSRMDEEELTGLGFKSIDPTLPASPLKPKSATVSHSRVKTGFLLTVPTVYGIQTMDTDMFITITNNGLCKPEEDLGIVAKYRLEYISQDIRGLREWSLLRDLNQDIWNNIQNNRLALYKRHEASFVELGYTESEVMAILFDAQQEYNTAMELYRTLPPEIPERVYELAASITSGETSDYGKAIAIENFFHSSGFRYDLSPPRLPYNKDINDYFLFESKRGFCVHFASAMVILARACGLPARYTEGFVCDEPIDQTGCYFVRANDAHAYPEVYIAGFGWMTFEPTVSASGNDLNVFLGHLRDQVKSIANTIRRLFLNLPPAVRLLFVPLFILGAFYVLWLITRLKYRLWLKRTLRFDENQALIRVFNRIIALMKNIRMDMRKADTPIKFADRVLAEKGIDIREIAHAYSRIRYGGYRLTRDELQTAMQDYKEIIAGVKAITPKPLNWLIH